MTRKRTIERAGLVAAVLCLPILAGSALADRDDRDRGRSQREPSRYQRDRDHDRDRGHDRQHNRPKIGFGFSFSIGDRGRDRGYSSKSAYVVRGSDCRGYWKTVYCPAVYKTYYDSCGRPYQRCISTATWKRVWVTY